MAAPKKTLVVMFVLERETKGTIRFSEAEAGSGQRPAIGTLYITKDALAGIDASDAQNLRVTVEVTR